MTKNQNWLNCGECAIMAEDTSWFQNILTKFKAYVV